MKRDFRKLYSWLLIAVMMLSMLVMQIPLAKPAYAALDQNSTITPVTAVFDKNSAHQADVPITMTLNGNTLNSVTNSGITLAAGIDYTVTTASSIVIIEKGYLALQATGTTTLNFVFSAGNPQTLQITVSDSTPALTKVLNYYQSTNYSKATTWWDMVGLWGVGDTKKTSWDSSQTSLYGNILGTLAKGEDPSNTLNGRNLLSELKATQDSSTGAFPGSYGLTSSDQIWAMVALDAAKAEYDKEKAVSNLLTYQNSDGAFFYSTGYNTSDPDQTGMALLALANHLTIAGVQTAINKSEAYLKSIQENTGGFASWGTDNPNSVATVISGLVAVGEDPLSDAWKKNGKTMLDDLLSFQLADGSFYSPYNPRKTDAMATYQSLIALGDLNAHKSVWQRLQESSPQGNSNSTITPLTAVFDKNLANQADVPITMTLNGNTLNSITNGGTALTAASDYTVATDGSTVTIGKNYLALQATGTITLNFIFSAGNPQTLQITISDTTPAYSSSLTKVLNYYKANSYSNATTWWDMVGLWGAGNTQKTSWDSSQTSLYGNILGTLAKGEDPSNTLNGRNLLSELKATLNSSTGAFPGSYGLTSSDQIWAMVALDAAKTQYDQEKAVSNLLIYQNSDGAFFYSTGYNSSDPDQTGMALLALANHQTVAGVQTAINNAKAYLKSIQQNTGGFASWGTDNPNSVATVISGLVAVGEDPLADGWKKNGKTMLDDLLSFQLDNGSFDSPYNPGKTDAMATYQSLIALGDLNAHKSVWQRLQEGSSQGNNNSIITPVTALFDKKTANQVDVPITMTLNGNTLNSITNGETTLTAGSDYTVATAGSTVTIAKGYLAQQATGTTTLNFLFSVGNSQTLQITVSDTTSSSPPTVQSNITLTVAGKNGQTILSSTTMSLENGDTAYSVLTRKLGQGQVTVTGAGSSFYVSGISGLNAGDDGATSGWMYSINGVYPSVGAASISLKNGDVVAWRYTTNLGKDLGDSSTVTTPVTSSTSPVDSTGSTGLSNQEVLAGLNKVTAQQKSDARLPGTTPTVSPTATEQVVLKATDGVQLTVPAGAVSNQSTPVKFTIEIGNVITPPKADTGAIVINPIKYQRQFGIENSTGTVQEEPIQFNAPININFPVASGDLPSGITTQQLAIYWWDTAKSDWIKLGGVYNPDTKTLSVPTYHFSTFAVMADGSSVPMRLAGLDRFQTANTVATQGWKAGADNVVLVNAYAFSDALAAVPLAFKLNAPILLTETDTLTPSTLEEIQKMTPKKITLIGGTAVISQAIQAELEKVYGADNVLRYGGPDRYSTAALIATALGTTGKAIIANGGENSYADALAVSSYAAYKGIPILFTERTVLPDPTVQALAAQKVSFTIVVGGSYVIPEAITQRLPGVVRYAGSDCYATATAIAQGLNLNTDRIYVVTGLDFADALTAGNLAAHSFSPVIMVDNAIPEATSSFLTAHKGTTSDLVIVGGTGIISADQEYKMRTIVSSLVQSQAGVITRQQVDESINGLATWEKATIQVAFTQAASGEIIDPTVYNWPTIGLGQLELYDGLSSYLAENEKYIAQDWNSVTQKVTNLARISLAVGAAKGDPRNFARKDLIAEIANYSDVEAQGINGPIFALIALNSGAYDLPSTAQWTPEKLLKIILNKQLTDGGFSLDGTGASDPDITSMALQALAPYNTASHPEVQAVVTKAVACLAELQDSEGGFKSGNTDSSESVSQTIIALSSLGIDIDTNPMFIKNNNTLLSALLRFRSADGGFKHLLTGNSDKTASEQALLALVSYVRLKDGKNSLYDFRP